jgi:hypothetical protein
MDQFCCSNAGGRFALTVHSPTLGTVQLDLRGSATIEDTTIETEAHSHSHGGMYVTTKSKPATVELMFSDSCKLRLNDLLNCHIDATLQLIDMGRTYFFTRARLVGKPSLKTEDGEISGLKLASGRVSVVYN